MNASPERLVEDDQIEDGRQRLEPDSLFVTLVPSRAEEVRAAVAHASVAGACQSLIPRRPPGRCNRKARAFSSEIKRLHAEGYSFEAIREALAEAGVVVSNSTVQREAARGTSPIQAAPSADCSP